MTAVADPVMPTSFTASPSLAPSAPTSGPVRWPRKYDVLGVEVSATSYGELVPLLIRAARRRQPALASLTGVHGVSLAAMDSGFKYRLNAFDVVAPDGQPIRWALNKLHRAGLSDRVYGPELMIRLCQAAAVASVPIYLYGSTPAVLAKLSANLESACPGLQIVGAESPPFRPLSPAEVTDTCHRINASGAGLLFLGIGCPRQDIFAHDNRHAIKAVQLCVGAAFDFHAGTKKVAPAWMQKRGLEWLFRLTQEPGRLWKRYLVNNTVFCWLMAKRLVTGR